MGGEAEEDTDRDGEAGELQVKNNNILKGFTYNFQVPSLYVGLALISFLKSLSLASY